MFTGGDITSNLGKEILNISGGDTIPCLSEVPSKLPVIGLDITSVTSAHTPSVPWGSGLTLDRPQVGVKPTPESANSQ